MTVRVYRWDDASAPTLNGVLGSFVTLLDACLVNGYGAKAGSGWTKEFSGTNKAAYKQGTGGNGHYLRVDHSATAAAARVLGYEAMTSVDAGSGAFPTEAQLSGGGYFLASSTSDATARPWVLVATSKAFHLWVGYNVTPATGLATVAAMPMYFFGKMASDKVGDAFDTLAIFGTAATSSGFTFGTMVAGLASLVAGHFIARSFTQVGAAVTAGKPYDLRTTSTTMGLSGTTYPDPVTGGLMLGRVTVSEPSVQVVRGSVPGVFAPLHSLPGAPGDVFSGTGALAGKQFILLDVGATSNRGRCALEISDTW